MCPSRCVTVPGKEREDNTRTASSYHGGPWWKSEYLQQLDSYLPRVREWVP